MPKKLRGRTNTILLVFSLLALGFVFLALFAVLTPPASADWRWAPPHFKKHKVTFTCDSLKCVRQHYLKERHRYKRKTKLHNQRRLREWRHWSKLYIPTCTWFGESGEGPQFASIRYITPNAGGSGAYGKYQMMGPTYHSQAKYHDWSPLDQEIAGHREYWAHGIFPWQNCTG